MGFPQVNAVLGGGVSLVVTQRSVGRTPLVWALALSGLIAFAGHSVWARVRAEQGPAQSSQAPASQAPASQVTTNRPSTPQGQRGGHFDGPGPQVIGRNWPPPSPFRVGWEWWKDEDVKKEIGLRADQAGRIDRYYSARMKEIDPVVQEYQRETVILNKMVDDRLVDDSTLSVEMTKFYALRTSVDQSRTMMDYRIAKVLDLEQYAKLKAIADRRLKEAEARRGRGGGLAPSPGGLLR